jgi:predicted secreted protein
MPDRFNADEADLLPREARAICRDTIYRDKQYTETISNPGRGTWSFKISKVGTPSFCCRQREFLAEAVSFGAIE